MDGCQDGWVEEQVDGCILPKDGLKGGKSGAAIRPDLRADHNNQHHGRLP